MASKFDELAIIEEYKKCNRCRIVAEMFGCSDETVRRVLIKYDIPRVKRNPRPVTRPKATEEELRFIVDEYYQTRCSINDLSKKYHRAQATISKAIKEYGNGIKSMNNFHRDDNFAQKFLDEELIELIEKGFTRAEISKKLNVHIVTIDKRMKKLGVYAKHKERPPKKQQYVHTLEEYKRIRRESSEIKKLEDIWYNAVHTVDRKCEICRTIFHCLDTESRKTCSSTCSKKYNNHRLDRRLNYKNIVDRNITLTELYNRDKGICALCGGKCDFNDYEIDEKGNRITHDNYPSIDHIKPLSRGGKHQWKNVQLAHFKCNYIKGNRYVEHEDIKLKE